MSVQQIDGSGEYLVTGRYDGKKSNRSQSVMAQSLNRDSAEADVKSRFDGLKPQFDYSVWNFNE